MPRLPALLLLPLAAALGQAPTPAPLPPFTTEPLAYTVLRTPTPLSIDGDLSKPAWSAAPWTTDFLDIQGSSQPNPPLRTRLKMLYDDHFLYVAAELAEPNLLAYQTEHDSVIFHDNDFEVFLQPLPDTRGYFEFEINARNTSWDLYLNRPYREGGHADNTWDIPNLQTAVRLDGTLNHPSDTDHGWTVEIAFPLAAFQLRQPAVATPQPGTIWRANFSRVEWVPGHPREDNWVWSPQGVINMHVPARWGYLHFQ